jgi:large repetitive protein
LRTELQAISGNPNLYLRTNAPPTLSHNAIGAGGPLYNRALTNNFTEYGNWAVLNGKAEYSLTPGIWYLAVYAAGGSHVRYRLEVSIGSIGDIAFSGGSVTNQELAAGDWRYYRVQVPVDMPDAWMLSYTRQQGDVALYLRDTVPPGQGVSATDLIDWKKDGKNHGPYPYFTNAGSYTLTVPAVRPGNLYYIGVLALSDVSFSISSVAGTNPIPLNGILAFKDGYVTNQIPPGGVLRFRIDVPADGRRWQHSAVHASSVKCFLDQGTLPTLTTADHWSSVGANSTFNAVLYNSSWPWLPGYRYYLAITNTSAATQPFSFRMDGKDCSNDDYDNDGLPDCWEIAHFGDIYTYGPNSDPDGDGFTNLQEYLAGSDPMDPHSLPNSSSVSTTLSAPIATRDGKFGFYVNGPTNRIYRVMVSSALASGSWSEITNYLQLTPTQLIVVPLDTSKPSGFYRVVAP